MRQRTVTSTRDTAAPIDHVWHLLSDVGQWRDWAPVRDPVLERPGGDDPNGVGAVRSFGTPTGTTREEIVISDAPHRQSYVLLSGPPLEQYRSDVVLRSTPEGGTTITWTSSFGSNLLWWLLIAAAVRSYSRRLAVHAARTAPRRPA